jgi:hypothetical protein
VLPGPAKSALRISTVARLDVLHSDGSHSRLFDFGRVRVQMALTQRYSLFEDGSYDMYKQAPNGTAYEDGLEFYDAASHRNSSFFSSGTSVRAPSPSL